MAAGGMAGPPIAVLLRELLEDCRKSRPFSKVPATAAAPAAEDDADEMRAKRSVTAADAAPGGALEVLDEVVPDIEVVAAVANEAAVAAEAVVKVGVELIVDVEACMAEVVVLPLPPLVVTAITICIH